tara:strand:+ start:154 stop:603 length:450 start_codon:yes stop_codon:yes gene_type:complete
MSDSSKKQVAGGNGRGYFPLSAKSAEIENKRRDALADAGHTWAKTEPFPDGDGYIMVSRCFVDFLDQAVERNDNEDFRLNYKFWKNDTEVEGGANIAFKDSQYRYTEEGVGNRYQNFRDFKKEWKPKHSSAVDDFSEAEDVLEDDDIPF